MQYYNVTHDFGPIYDSNSKILILGSFPSVKSREENFYYGHPRNRFWPIISSLLQEKLPQNIEEKRAMLLNYHIALWDVISQCDIIGSSDSSITNVIPNDISHILQNCNIRMIFTNGNKAHLLFQKYIYPSYHINDILLPSTSPANASYTEAKLLAKWKSLLSYL